MLAASYQAMHDAYRERETVFAAVMADRADWDAATRQQRHLAVAADTELHRRHPDQRFTPQRSAEPQPATDAQRVRCSCFPLLVSLTAADCARPRLAPKVKLSL